MWRNWSGNRPLTPEEYHAQLLERFWANVDMSKGLGPDGNCWEWIGSRTCGYGQMSYRVKEGKFRAKKAHSIAFTLIYGNVLLPGQMVCHKCNNKPCVRHSHLFAGTNLDNVKHAQLTGLIPSKITDDDVREILRLISVGKTYPQIAAQFGITISYISKIKRGYRKSWVK